jgi:hypothetical protein
MKKRILLAGVGAVGSRVAALLSPENFCAAFADDQKVAGDNVGVADYAADDVDHDKAVVCARRFRARGGEANALVGALRYTLRPGFARALDAAVLCLDNATAIFDATGVLWHTAAAAELPVLALTCGSNGASFLARQYVRPHVCAVCLFGAAEREADRRVTSNTCTDTSAPRASAQAAQAAAAMGVEMLQKWFAGDRSFANRRIQHDGRQQLTVRMPAEPSPWCVVHGSMAECRGGMTVDLGGSIAQIQVGQLAEAALAHAGRDAELRLDRRAIPLAGLYCTRCRRISAAPFRLLPAARAAWQACGCGAALQPLAERHVIRACELLDPEVAALSLAAFGAGHGDEFEAVSARGRLRLACSFDWSDLDG